jgi:hypothetical protein
MRSQCSEMRYCKISKKMSLFFGLTEFRLFEARVPEFDTQPLPPTPCTVYSTLYTGQILGL